MLKKALSEIHEYAFFGVAIVTSSVEYISRGEFRPAISVKINLVLVMGLNPADLRGDGPDSTMVRETPLEDNDAAAQELGSSAWRGDGSLARGSGYPIKRSLHTENQKTDSNGLHSDSNSMEFGWRSKSHLLKSKGEKGDGGCLSLKRRSLVLSILISIVVGCFLIETMLQNSMSVLFRHTEFFPGLTGEVLGKFGERRPLAEQLLFGANVRFVPSKLEERFVSHRSIDELREQMRNANRPPQLAIVSMLGFWLCMFYVWEINEQFAWQRCKFHLYYNESLLSSELANRIES